MTNTKKTERKSIKPQGLVQYLGRAWFVETVDAIPAQFGDEAQTVCTLRLMGDVSAFENGSFVCSAGKLIQREYNALLAAVTQ